MNPIRPFRRAMPLALITAMAACGGRGPGEDATNPELRDDYVLEVASSPAYTEPTTVHKGLGIHAQAIGPVIVVSVVNRSDREMVLVPQNFAMIKGPNRQTDLVPVNPATAELAGFSGPLRLRPGQNAVVRIAMRGFNSVQGFWLVFNDPAMELLFRVPIS